MATEINFNTPCGRHGTIKPVRATGGPKEGHWVCKIKGPKVTGSGGVKAVYLDPSLAAAQAAIARFIRTQSSQVLCADVSNAASWQSPSRTPPAVAVSPSFHRNFQQHELKRSKAKHFWRQRHTGTFSQWSGQVPSVFSKDQASLRLPDPRIKEDRDRLLSRSDLREYVKLLRSAFATRLRVPPYCIFDDATLDDITVELPQTKLELMACKGIKEKRCQNFGAAILAITRWYKEKQNGRGVTKRGAAHADDDTLEVGETLSCQAIVAQKFAHAEADGYVIEI